jgi:membrane-bound lytic murein transglycosylase B
VAERVGRGRPGTAIAAAPRRSGTRPVGALAAAVAVTGVTSLVVAIAVATFAVAPVAAAPAPTPSPSTTVAPNPAADPNSTAPPVTGPTTTILTAPPGADAAAQAAATNDFMASQTLLTQADQKVTAARAALAAATSRQIDATNKRAVLAQQAQQAADRLSAARKTLRHTAVAEYVSGGNDSLAGTLLHATDIDSFARGREYGYIVLGHEKLQVQQLADAFAKASEPVRGIGAETDRAQAAHDLAALQVEAATTLRQQRFDDASRKGLLVQLVTAAAPAPPSDIPRLFLDAYIRAASAADRRYPACSVHWSAIAAIGKLETGHGREGGAALTLSGDVVPHIIGPALDGTNGFGLVADTDQGRLDGDPVFDRAVGPMQFIPATWQSVAQDGNGDGVVDPNNAYDAALATATYLCRSGAGNLELDQNLHAAALTYNHSESYAQRVVDGSHQYDALHLPGAPPGPPAAAPPPVPAGG